MIQAVVPAIRVQSYLTSKAFYGAVGFHEQWIHQFEADFPIFASVVREGMQIFLTEHSGDCEFGEELEAAGIAVAEPPNNRRVRAFAAWSS